MNENSSTEVAWTSFMDFLCFDMGLEPGEILRSTLEPGDMDLARSICEIVGHQYDEIKDNLETDELRTHEEVRDLIECLLLQSIPELVALTINERIEE